jgi:hypothetical protein
MGVIAPEAIIISHMRKRRRTTSGLSRVHIGGHVMEDTGVGRAREAFIPLFFHSYQQIEARGYAGRLDRYAKIDQSPEVVLSSYTLRAARQLVLTSAAECIVGGCRPMLSAVMRQNVPVSIEANTLFCQENLP